MSIIHSFDSASPEILTADRFIPKIDKFPEVLISCWGESIHKLMEEKFELLEISHSSMASWRIPIYVFDYKGTRLGFYHSMLGGPASVAIMEEVIAMGGRKFLFFGSCGALQSELTAGKVVVPTHAYRDEGTSYHYAPASDYIEVKTADKLCNVLDELKIPYLKSKTWTTDGVYRETMDNIAKRREAGCAVVDMECASIMAAAQFRGVEAYQFLFAADSLDGAQWDSRTLGNMPSDSREQILTVALESAIKL